MVKVQDIFGYLATSVDPVPILKELSCIGVILGNEVNELLNLHPSRLYPQLFQILKSRKINKSALFYILLRTGNLDLCNSLKCDFTTKSTVARFHRAEPGITETVRSYFNDLKTDFLNATCKDPLVVLHRERNSLEHSRIQVLTTDCDSKQTLIDKEIALLGNVLDASLMTFRSKQQREQVLRMFKDLGDLVQISTNANLSDVIYYSRMALFKDMHYYDGHQMYCQTSCQQMDGEDMLLKAHECAATLTPCLELANLFFIHLLHELWRFERSPTQEIKQSLLYLGTMALECLKQENIFVQTLWKRLICLKSAFCLLGISNNLVIIHGFIPDKDDVYEARIFLQMFDECREFMPMVRKLEMYYNLCRSRQYELSGEIIASNCFAKEVQRIALGGNFREVEAVLSYCKSVSQVYTLIMQLQTSHYVDIQKPVLLSNDEHNGILKNKIDYIPEFIDLRDKNSSPIVNKQGIKRDLSQKVRIKCDDIFFSGLDGFNEDSITSEHTSIPLWSSNQNAGICKLCERLLDPWKFESDDNTDCLFTCNTTILFGNESNERVFDSSFSCDTEMLFDRMDTLQSNDLNSDLLFGESGFSCPSNSISSIDMLFGSGNGWRATTPLFCYVDQLNDTLPERGDPDGSSLSG